MNCAECEKRLNERTVNYRYRECGLPNVTLVAVVVEECPECGYSAVRIPRIAELHRVIAATLIRKPGRLTGDEVRFLRKHLGFSGVDFARMLGVAPETVSRWESGATRIGATAERALRLLVVNMVPIQDYKVFELASLTARPAPQQKLRFKVRDEEWLAATA